MVEERGEETERAGIDGRATDGVGGRTIVCGDERNDCEICGRATEGLAGRGAGDVIRGEGKLARGETEGIEARGACMAWLDAP